MYCKVQYSVCKVYDENIKINFMYRWFEGCLN